MYTSYKPPGCPPSQDFLCTPRMQDHTLSQVKQTNKQPLPCFKCTKQVIGDFSSWALHCKATKASLQQTTFCAWLVQGLCIGCMGWGASPKPLQSQWGVGFLPHPTPFYEVPKDLGAKHSAREGWAGSTQQTNKGTSD